MPPANAQALALYRALLREARRMPTANRRQFIRQRVRDEFRAAARLTDDTAVAFRLSLAETQLDNITVQRELLSRLESEGNLKGPKD